MQLHMDVNQKSKFSAEHFAIWLQYFNSTIDENFKGQIAKSIKNQGLVHCHGDENKTVAFFTIWANNN